MPTTTTPFYVRLTWTDPGTGHELERLARLPVTLGRAAENTISLNSRSVSRQHAQIERTAEGEVVLMDRHSSNGTFLHGQRIAHSALQEGASFQIGPFAFSISFLLAAEAQAATLKQPIPMPWRATAFTSSSQDESTVILQNNASTHISLTPPAPVEEVFPPASFQQPIVSMQQLRDSRLSLTETTYLAIGGGMGSFAWIDHLRVAGVPAEQIICISPESRPNSRFTRLCQNSQIPLHERVRSHSEACPDNLWGFPSYGVREIWRSVRKGQIGNALHVAGQLLEEPVLADTYTPRAGDVFASLDREARRIGWERMWRAGRARAIRKTDDGRYVIALTRTHVPPEQRHQLMVARYIHICVGYPGIQLLPDLQDYRERMQDFKRVVNAYEYHEHVYQHLLQRGGTVMVRGRGIVASRVIQRLHEVRQQNPNVRILHLMRSPMLPGSRHGYAHHKIENHWEFKPFGWPKSCWGGSYLIKMEKADDTRRDQLINDWSGTTTARRKDWRWIIKTGLRGGWYQIGFGNVKRLECTPTGQLATLIQSAQPGQPENWLGTDFVIDCTGLEQGLEYHTLLHDLVTHHQLGRNPKGRLKVTNDFVVLGMENGDGRVYAAGIMTLGGPHAAQDSFLGLQYAALRSVDALAALRAPGVRRINGLHSFRQWTRWVRGAHP
ncbi:MAG TPA: FHA domain-containing protein [Ktedonobacterales bacterium]|nr:FHA domain-containing protein [Ktedonobacterales bacterium]